MAEDSSVLTELTGHGGGGSNTTIDREWTIDFHGVTYIINLTVRDALLTLEIEDADSNERWCADFTSQYIEEITLKAGNFKKFSTFVTMCCSGFGRDNESVFMDILTAADLETLKARKTGARSAQPPPGGPQGKRYVILTYSGEFDRVHYPLPLTFESPPSTEALLRTVARLRTRLAERADQQEGLEASSSSDRDTRTIIANLRQENTELRHRLRQADSRKGVSSPGQAGMVNELTAANSKLRRQVEALRKELQEASASHEKQRAEAQKEVNKWKLRVGAAARDRLEFYSNPKQAPAPARSQSPTTHAGSSSQPRSSARPWDGSLSNASNLASRGARPGRSVTPPPNMIATYRAGAASSSSSHAHASSTRSPKSVYSSTTASIRSRHSPAPNQSNNYSSSSGAGSARRPPVPPSGRSLSANPHMGTARGREVRSESPTNSLSRRVASSVGGRFDPTLYQQQRAAIIAQNSGRPWSAGSRGVALSASNNSSRNYDSGYSSRDSEPRHRSSSANVSSSTMRASNRGASGSPSISANNAGANTSGGKKRRARRKSREPSTTSSTSRRKGAHLPSDSEDDRAGGGAGGGGRLNRSLIDSPAASPLPAGSSQASASAAGANIPPMPFPTVDPSAASPKAPPSMNAKTANNTNAKTAASSSATAPAAAKRSPIKADALGIKGSPRSPARRFVSAVTSQAIRWSRDSSNSNNSHSNSNHSSLDLGGGGTGAFAGADGEREWQNLRSSGGSNSSGARPRSALGSSSSSAKGSPKKDGARAGAAILGVKGLGLGAVLSASAEKDKGEKRGDEEISEIDRRIQALQSYLDNARGSLLSDNRKR